MDFDDDAYVKDFQEWRTLHYPACSLCGSDKLVVSRTVGLPILRNGALVPGRFLEYAPLTCGVCGYTVFVLNDMLKQITPPEDKTNA